MFWNSINSFVPATKSSPLSSFLFLIFLFLFTDSLSYFLFFRLFIPQKEKKIESTGLSGLLSRLFWRIFEASPIEWKRMGRYRPLRNHTNPSLPSQDSRTSQEDVAQTRLSPLAVWSFRREVLWGRNVMLFLRHKKYSAVVVTFIVVVVRVINC